MSNILECGHPKECLGINATDDQTICGWCADMSDMAFVTENVAKVYDHITGGLLSKPNYSASVVIEKADEYTEILIQEAIRDFVNETTYVAEDIQP